MRRERVPQEGDIRKELVEGRVGVREWDFNVQRVGGEIVRKTTLEVKYTRRGELDIVSKFVQQKEFGNYPAGREHGKGE